MFVAKWAPGPKPVKPELTSAPVWLEFKNVPYQFWSEEGWEHIAGMVGHPILVHPATLNMTNLEVGKVLIVIDPRKPLPEEVNAQFESGEICRIEVSSPWMPPICSHCSQVGHSLRRCPSAPKTCISCNSTSHQTESCPRPKSAAGPSKIKKSIPIAPKPVQQEVNSTKHGQEEPSIEPGQAGPLTVSLRQSGSSTTNQLSVAFKEKRKSEVLGADNQQTTVKKK